MAIEKITTDELLAEIKRREKQSIADETEPIPHVFIYSKQTGNLDSFLVPIRNVKEAGKVFRMSVRCRLNTHRGLELYSVKIPAGEGAQLNREMDASGELFEYLTDLGLTEVAY